MKIKRYTIIPTVEGLTECELDEEGEWVHIDEVEQLLAGLLREKSELQSYASFITHYWNEQGGA